MEVTKCLKPSDNGSRPGAPLLERHWGELRKDQAPWISAWWRRRKSAITGAMQET